MDTVFGVEFEGGGEFNDSSRFHPIPKRIAAYQHEYAAKK
jgi:hypothetical protein